MKKKQSKKLVTLSLQDVDLKENTKDIHIMHWEQQTFLILKADVFTLTLLRHTVSE
jgi:hypothetical protein